jgi:hypothetical protein
MNPMETLEEVVNKATDKMLIGPDWTFNLRIIDTLNNKPELYVSFKRNLFRFRSIFVTTKY